MLFYLPSVLSGEIFKSRIIRVFVMNGLENHVELSGLSRYSGSSYMGFYFTECIENRKGPGNSVELSGLSSYRGSSYPV